MVVLGGSPNQHFNISSTKSNSIISKHSGNGSDSDSEEDENERRKYINLQSGHGMLWSSELSTHLDLSKSVVQDQKYYEDLVFARRNVLFGDDGTSGSRRSSLKHGTILDLDAIQLNSDFEYGFNPNRPSGSKANVKVKLRPLSLYSPESPREKKCLTHTFSDAKAKYTVPLVLDTVSHASNDYEIHLEKELASIRSQPCNLTFQGCEGKLDKNEFAEDLANSRRRRKIRRQLSFDSHPSQRWNKTLSLDSGLATDNSFKSNHSKNSIKEKEERSKSQNLLDLDLDPGIENVHSYSVECLLNDITPVSTPDDVDTKETIEKSFQQQRNNTSVDGPIPKFVDDRPPEQDILLGTMSYDVNKTIEKQKRRGSIPHILSAFRLPNKKLKKLIRKKPQDTNIPVKVSHDINPNVTLIESKKTEGFEERSPKLEVTASIGQDNFSFSDSVNTFEKPKNKEYPNNMVTSETDKSVSLRSLPKVDEEKESLEFRTIDRRSRSSCSITKSDANTPRDSTDNEHRQRRMSDTVLSWNEKSVLGTSPCKRFVRKLLSPVVCGLPSPDKHGIWHGSFTSLGSYDSGSIISETEESCPHLFDFGSHELMEEMARIDKELLIRIPWGELSILGWMSPDKLVLAPNIMKMVQFFNRVVMMVTTSILAEGTAYRRAKIVQKAIKLALKLRYKKNFNSLKAVLSGLQCTPIFRLKATWKQVPSRYRRVFRELSELMSEENNFCKYRHELESSLADPPCIPFLGNFLTTVAHVHAYAAVQIQYKNNVKSDANDDDSVNGDGYMISPPYSPPAINSDDIDQNCEVKEDIESTDPCLQENSTSKITTACHIRTDSDDSGVVLNVNRLSNSSEDLEPSPRENLNSPDEESSFRNSKFEEVFNKNTAANRENNPNICKCPEDCPQHPRDRSIKKHCYSESDFLSGNKNMNRIEHAQEVITSPTRHGRSISVDNADLLLKQATEIVSIINNRPVMREKRDDLYECELLFWKYQTAAVQYNIIPRTYIRRYLMNSPYNTEEESYKLSLTREPPAVR